jgi:hypothetical protein
VLVLRLQFAEGLAFRHNTALQWTIVYQNGIQRTSLAGLADVLDLAHPLGHGRLHVLASRTPHALYGRPVGLELLRPSEITLQMKGLSWEQSRLSTV